MIYLKAFVVGGLICTLVQIFLDNEVNARKSDGVISNSRSYSWSCRII